MKKNWKMIIVESSAMYGLVTALLFAGVFSLISISGTLSRDMIFGAITGAPVGILISVVVGVVDRGLTRGAGMLPNAIVGLLAGALIASGTIFVMVQLVGFIGTTQLRSIFDLPLCCSVGIPLGVIIGSLIGASWRSEEMDSRSA